MHDTDNLIAFMHTVESENINPASKYADEVYDERFRKYFVLQKNLSYRFSSDSSQITDEELSTILIEIPLKLYDASEALNKLRLSVEVIKLRESELKKEFASQYDSNCGLSKSDWLKSCTVDIQLMQGIYETVIKRVENQISYTKELIMGAKKIWDSRRESEKSMPVGEVVDTNADIDSLPEYHVYIK